MEGPIAVSFQGYKSLLENSPDAISLINKENLVLYASDSNTNLLDHGPDEIAGRHFLELLHPEDRGKSGSLLMFFDLHHAATQALQNLALEVRESGAVLKIGDLPSVCSNEIHLARVFKTWSATRLSIEVKGVW